jgi:large subunit ribosomal protein L9
MEVILREDVASLGHRGDVVKVAEGYGRNYLLPQGKALAVTPANRARIEKERKAVAAKLAKEKAEFEDMAKKIEGIRLVAPRKVGEKDQLFGSVTSHDIADLLKAKGFEVDKRKVVLEDPIKTLGEHTVKVKLHPEVATTIRVLVTKEA